MSEISDVDELVSLIDHENNSSRYSKCEKDISNTQIFATLKFLESVVRQDEVLGDMKVSKLISIMSKQEEAERKICEARINKKGLREEY